MNNLPPQSLSMMNSVSSIAPLRVSTHSGSTVDRMAYMKRLVIELSKPDLRENAIRVLSKRTELFHELAPLLWNSVGTIEVLLQEITSIYPNLSPPTLSHAQSTRVCNVIALLRCLASHPDTMSLIIAMIPMYLYPFLQTTNTLPQFDWLRLASLGVIGVL
ncbi:cell differentiation RCD1-like protein, partial [Trifolium pratense]